MAGWGTDGIDGSALVASAKEGIEKFEEYQKQEEALLNLYTKRKLQQIKLAAIADEKTALKSIAVKTEAEMQRLKDLEKEEAKLRRQIRASNKKINQEQEASEALFYSKRKYNIESLARRQRDLNAKILHEEDLVKEKQYEEQLKTDENLFDIRVSMLADLQKLEITNKAGIYSSDRNCWTALNKEKRSALAADMKANKKYQEMAQQREQSLQSIKTKNIMARADWEINQADIVHNAALQKHEQRNTKLLELEQNLAISKEDQESFIVDTIHQRQLESAQKIQDHHIKLILERRDFTRAVENEITEFIMANDDRINKARREAAKYNGGKGKRATKRKQKMVESESNARHEESVAKVAKNDFELEVLNFDEEQQIADAIKEATSAHNLEIAKQRRDLKIAEIDFDNQTLAEKEKLQLASDKRLSDSKLKLAAYESLSAEEKLKLINDATLTTNNNAQEAINRKQIELAARQGNIEQAAINKRRDEELNIATEIATNKETLLALQADKEQRFLDTTAKKQSQYAIDEEKAEQDIEQARRDRELDIAHEISMARKKHLKGIDDLDKSIITEKLDRETKVAETLDTLARSSADKTEKLNTKLATFQMYSAEQLAKAEDEIVRKKMEEHNYQIETLILEEAIEKVAERRGNLAEQMVHAEAEIQALRALSAEELHEQVQKEIQDAERSAVAAMNAAKAKAAMYAGGDDSTSDEDREANIKKMQKDMSEQQSAESTAKVNQANFMADYKKQYQDTININRATEDQAETREKLVDLANDTAYYEKYAADIALRKIQTDTDNYKNKAAQLETERLAYTKYTDAQMAAADDATKAKMLEHNLALELYQMEQMRADEAERMTGYAKEHLDTETKIKELRNTSEEEIGKGAASILESGINSALEALKKARMETAAYTAYSDEEIEAEDNETKKQQMKEHNAQLAQYKLDSVDAKLGEITAATAKKRVDTQIAVDPRVLKAEEDAKHEESWLSELQAKPGDANYSLTSMNYQNDIADALAKATKDDGSIDQELYAKEMALIEKKYSTEGALYKDHLARLAKLEEEERIQAVRDAELKPLKEKADLNKKKKEGVVSDFKTAFNPGMLLGSLFGDEDAKAARGGAMKRLFQDEEGNFDPGKALSSAISGLSSVLRNLENKMKEVGKYQAPIDTRLYGTTHTFRGTTGIFTAMAAASPTILQSDLMDSMLKLVESGISHNVQLRAYLDVASKKIATTFEVADSTLLKLVRIQQADTTLARLGMESALNKFLNNMYETTEYLTSLADSVRANLYEAQALMGAKEATEFEFQVQKWLGSMSSVGMSDEAVNKISTALGQLASGQIEALTGGGVGNLLVMAANKSKDLSLGDILADGLNADQTNQLLQASVEYLKEIADRSDSKVVQQELAKIFGVTAADLKAIGNLTNDNGRTLKNISKRDDKFASFALEAIKRDATAFMRTNMGEMMSNVWENLQWTMAAGMASNPVSYLMFKVANLLEDSTGGIDLPFLNVYGFGVDLNTTVAQLMQVGSMAGGILSSLAMGVAGLAGAGTSILSSLGATPGLKQIARGDGGGGGASGGENTSASGLIANGSGGDMKAATMAEAAADMAKQSIQGKEDNEDATRDDIIEFLMKQFEILWGKFDLSISALKLSSLSLGDKINGTEDAQAILMGGWSNGSISNMSGTTKIKL